MSAASFSEAISAQRRYARAVRADGLVVARSFLRSSRRSGYVSSATALSELVDNSLEAGAKNIHIVFGFGDSSSKPDALAVIDDGHGMEPLMLRVALLWGATHREDSRVGFGRFGFGLPAASVSQGRHVSVYSRAPGGRLYGVELAVNEDAASTAGVSSPHAQELPPWLEAYCRRMRLSVTRGVGHGTVVVIRDLDGLTWRTAVALERNLDRAIGLTYRNFLRRVRMFIQGTRIEPIDPLFLTEGARYRDLDTDRAQAIPWPDVHVERPHAGHYPGVRVRAAYFPPTFPRIDKAREATGLNANERFAVMKENRGLVIMRMGRQIDVVTSGLWTQFQNNDRYWALELDFPAELDEELSVTANKQAVSLSARVVEALRDAEIPRLIDVLRERYKRDRERLSSCGPYQAAQSGPPSPAAVPRQQSGPSQRAEGGVNRDDSLPRAWSTALAKSPGLRSAVISLIAALAASEADSEPAFRDVYRREMRRWAGLLGAEARA